jgi:RNA polymerase sigma-70 factor (ECF subfamily)
MEAAALAALVEAARAGDERAMGELVRATQDRLFRFVFLLGADRALANDLCQDAYLYALEHLSELREPAALQGWLSTIARNKFLDHVKSPRHSASAPLEAAPELPAPDLETVQQVRQALSKLDAEDRSLILLVDLEGHSYGEAAELLGISEAALTSRLRRARAAFHALYFPEGDRNG